MSTEQQQTQPKPIENASEAAKLLIDCLPRVQIGDKWYIGYYKSGAAVVYPPSIDRPFAIGTIGGISRGNVALGNQALLGSLNVSLIKPLEEAIRETNTKNESERTSDEVAATKKNQELLSRLCYGIEVAASFGIFVDQPLAINRGKMTHAGFSGESRGR